MLRIADRQERLCAHRRLKVVAEVEDSVVIFRQQGAGEPFQFVKSVVDLRWVGFMRFRIGQVKLILDGFTIAVSGIKRVSIYVSFQMLSNLIYVGSSSLSVI